MCLSPLPQQRHGFNWPGMWPGHQNFLYSTDDLMYSKVENTPQSCPSQEVKTLGCLSTVFIHLCEKMFPWPEKKNARVS